MTLHIPDVVAQERAKYAEIWSIEDYKNFSPGLHGVDRFMSTVKPKPAASLIDIGCGEGVAGLEFARRGFRVSYLDITDAGLRPDVPRANFIAAPLWAHWPGRWDYGFCCDVLEHIPPEYTMLCIDRILAACDVCYLQICNRPDNFGKVLGTPLHLTVQTFKDWLIRIATLGEVIEARDLCGTSIFVVTR